MEKFCSYVKDCSRWISDRFSMGEKDDGEGDKAESPRKKQKLESDDKESIIIESPSTSYTVFRGRDGVFQNSLLWRTLGEFLSIADLKAARLVCRNFNEQILTKTNFMDRIVIQFKEKSCASDSGILTNPHVQWKNVHIELFYTSTSRATQRPQTSSRKTKTRQQLWLLPRLKSVRMLKITAPKKPEELEKREKLKSQPTPNKKSFILNLPLLKILEGPDKLQNLVFDLDIFCRSEFYSDFEKLKTSEKFQSVVRNLHEFEIITVQSKSGTISSDSTNNGFSHSMEILSSILKKVGNLEILKFPGRSKDSFRRQSIFDLQQNSVQLVDLVTSKELRNKLTCVHWPLETVPGFWTTSNDNHHDNDNKLIFPSLKSLVLRTPFLASDGLITFLEKQPTSLQELDIIILKKFPTRLLQTIATYHQELRSLRLKTKRFDNPDFGWSFLKGFSSLQDFQLEFSPLELYYIDSPDHRVQVSKELFTSLPPSLEKLALKHFRFGMRKPTPGFSLTPQDLKSCLNSNILTELILKKCGGLVDDGTMQYICSELKKLKTLDVSGSSLCTDFGFTGNGSRMNGLRTWPFTFSSTCSSLKNLTDLTVLKLRCCGEISDVTCKNGIILPKLKYLDISRNKQITADGIMSILQNNLNLESIEISESAKSELKCDISWHPRLTSISVSKEPMTTRLSAPLRRNCSSEDSDASGETSDRGLLELSDLARWRFHCFCCCHCTCDSDSSSDW